MGIFLALLKALPELITFISAVFNFVKSQVDRGVGRKEAIAEALTISAEQLKQVMVIKAEADRIHSQDATDGAFDPEFKRKD